MLENGYIIDYSYDTSFKKYPYNKYYNAKELAKMSKKVFRDKTVDRTSKSQPAKKGLNKNRKSLMSAKTMCSSRARATSRQNNVTAHINPQNCRAFSKDDIASELHHYQELCLELRKENHSLKTKLDDKSKAYKDNLVDFQKKINKFNEKTLEMKEKELKIERDRLIEEKMKENSRRGKGKGKVATNHRQLEGDFKRFFLHFMDNCGRIDAQAQKRLINQKNMEGKLLLGQKLLK